MTEAARYQSGREAPGGVVILETSNNRAKTARYDLLWRVVQPDTPGVKDDEYAVYSTVLPHPIWNRPDDDRLLLIAESTGKTYYGMDPGECIHASPPYEKQLAEVLADYHARQGTEQHLEPRFRIKRPYKLLTDDEAQQFVKARAEHEAPRDPALAKLFVETPDLIRISQVFFDKKRTVALVLVSNYCGGLCGGEIWHALT